MQALDQLSKKLDTLLKKYAALEAENKRLQATITTQHKTVNEQARKLASLEHGMGMVGAHIGTVHDEEQKAHMRNQLDNVITEIDKILHSLNDQ